MRHFGTLLGMLLIIGVAIACNSALSPSPTPMVTSIPITLPKIALPTLTATPTPLFSVDLTSISSTTLQSPLPWKVEFVQGNRVVAKQNEEIRLAKQPFTIRVTLPQPLPVMLNVLDNDSNYQVVHAGLHTDCPIPFCIGGGMVEDDYYKLPTELFTGKEIFHYLALDTQGQNWYRWNRATVIPEGIVFERDVMLIDNTPLEQFRKAKLYLLFFVDYRDKERIDEDELLKFVLVFQ
jgi:hypothetical protein